MPSLTALYNSCMLHTEIEKPGVLLVGHGTRDAAGLAEFRLLVERVRTAANGQPVEGAFLELAEPALGEGVDRLVAAGCTTIRIVPLLLFAAGHAKQDVPAAADEAAARHRGLKVEIASPLGCAEPIVALSVRRYQETLSQRPCVPPEQSFLLLVGRGTSDAEAIEEVRFFTALRAKRTPVARAETCFVAVARPSLSEGLERAAAAGLLRVVVQPHLLFAGQVLDEITSAVARQAEVSPGIEWVLTGHLGPEAELVAAVLESAGMSSRAGLSESAK